MRGQPRLQNGTRGAAMKERSAVSRRAVMAALAGVYQCWSGDGCRTRSSPICGLSHPACLLPDGSTSPVVTPLSYEPRITVGPPSHVIERRINALSARSASIRACPRRSFQRATAFGMVLSGVVEHSGHSPFVLDACR